MQERPTARPADHYARKVGKHIKRVNKKTLELLQSYPWPGNIRELQNVIERSVILCETEIFSIDESWLPQRPSPTEPKNEIELPQKLLAQEKGMIEAALKETRGRACSDPGGRGQVGHTAIHAGVEDSVPQNRQEPIQDRRRNLTSSPSNCFRRHP